VPEIYVEFDQCPLAVFAQISTGHSFGVEEIIIEGVVNGGYWVRTTPGLTSTCLCPVAYLITLTP
jgi:hypothetical protein